MKIYDEISLKDFDFWGGAKYRAKYLTCEELDQIEKKLEELHPDGMSADEINGIFWFDEDAIAEWLGYNDFEEIRHREDKKSVY